MKMNTKIFRAAIISALALQLIPSVVLAAPRQASQQTPVANFCTRVSTFKTNLTSRFSDNQSKLGQARQQRDQQVSARQTNQDNHLAQVRQEADQARDAEITALLAKADTDAKKQAVLNFQASLKTALKTRRAAVDAAIKAFRSGLAQVIATRETAIDRAINVYQTAVNTALQKAQSDCTAGVLPSTVRQNFLAAMHTAQQSFRTDRQNAEKIPAKVNELQNTRKLAIDKAFADFHAAMEQARKTLKAAFAAQ